MDRSYKFAILRLAPGGARDERLNIGVVVFASTGAEVYLASRLDKVRALSSGLDAGMMYEFADIIQKRDLEMVAAGVIDVKERALNVSSLSTIDLSELGTFICNTPHEFHTRIRSLLTSFVEPERVKPQNRAKKSRVFSEVRQILRAERVLAKRDENLDSHRILQSYELADGLVADFALKNGKMHIVETVDVTAEEVHSRKAISDIAVSAIVLEQARIMFGGMKTHTRLVYSASPSTESAAKICLDAVQHQGAELYNWTSTTDQIRLITDLSRLAVPLVASRR